MILQINFISLTKKVQKQFKLNSYTGVKVFSSPMLHLKFNKNLNVNIYKQKEKCAN